MKEDFLLYQTQTSPNPLALEISHAKGSYIYDTKENEYLDFVAGVSACTLGHSNPIILGAVKKQLDHYQHVMVYGEFIQAPAVKLSKLLAKLLPSPLETTYLVNSGTEAIDASIKLARRATGRSEILYAEKAYHGNSYGALSIMGYEARKKPFGPLLPDCRPVRFNSTEDLKNITKKTAAIVLETIQGGAGFIVPKNNYLNEVRRRCNETGTLLILDEIQPGFGRTGTLFAFEHYKVIPDILVMGKGMGGGLPIGAFTASAAHMKLLSINPSLGHITTFGGNPVIASAALATLEELTSSELIKQTLEKEKLIRHRLKHPLIKEIRGKGLMLALIFDNADLASEVILKSKDAGLLLFWLLFEPCAVRITPPLTITADEINKGCDIITDVLNSLQKLSN